MTLLRPLLGTEKKYVLLAQILEFTGNFIFFKLLATLVKKEVMGDYLIATSALSFFLITSFSVLDQGFLRIASTLGNDKQVRTNFSACLIIYAAISCLWAICILVISPLVNHTETAITPISLALIALVFLEPLKISSNTLLNSRRERKLTALTKLIEIIVKLSLLVLTVTSRSLSSASVLLILAASSVASSSFSIYHQRRYLGFVNKQIAVDIFRQLTAFSWPLLIWGVFGWMQQMLNRLFLDFYQDSLEVANYGVISSISSYPFTLVLSVIAAYSLPIIYQKADHDFQSAYMQVSQTIKATIPAIAIILLLLTILQKPIILLAASGEYLDYSWLLPLCALGNALIALGTVMSYTNFAANNTKLLILPNILPGVLSLLFGILLIPSFGIHGAITNSLIASTSFLSFHAYAYLRTKRTRVITIKQ